MLKMVRNTILTQKSVYFCRIIKRKFHRVSGGIFFFITQQSNFGAPKELRSL